MALGAVSTLLAGIHSRTFIPAAILFFNGRKSVSSLPGDAGAQPEPLPILVDDVRDFKDGRAAVVLRTSADAVAYVQGLDGGRVDELWLDHDLFGEDTVQPLVDLLVADAANGRPLRVGPIWVHSSNIREGHRVVQELAAAGYPVQRSYAANLWRHSW